MTAKKGSTNGAVAATEPITVLVDLDQLTISEVAAAEALANVPITYAMDPEKPKGIIFQALACVVRKRTDPDFTFADAADVIVQQVVSKPIPPTNGRASSTRSRSARTSPSSAGQKLTG